MEHERLFVLQIVVSIQERWESSQSNAAPMRIEERFAIQQMLFSSRNEESAYETARAWIRVGAFSDANHDGAGDLTTFNAVGIHELQEITPIGAIRATASQEYGIDLPGFDPSDVDSSGRPTVRDRDDLEVFRLRRIMRGT